MPDGVKLPKTGPLSVHLNPDRRWTAEACQADTAPPHSHTAPVSTLTHLPGQQPSNSRLGQQTRPASSACQRPCNSYRSRQTYEHLQTSLNTKNVIAAVELKLWPIIVLYLFSQLLQNEKMGRPNSTVCTLSVYCVSLLNNLQPLQTPCVRMNSYFQWQLNRYKWVCVRASIFRLNWQYLHLMLSRKLQLHNVTSLLTGTRSSTTRTTTCWEWRRLPSTTRARSPVWQKTVWASWRPPPLSLSEVRNTFCSLWFLSRWRARSSTYRSRGPLRSICACAPIWALDLQFTPQGPLHTMRIQKADSHGRERCRHAYKCV